MKPGFPVGVVDTPQYEDQTVHLRPGDRLFLYSDGVTEVLNPAGEQFGADSLCDVFRSAATLPLDDCLDEVLDRVRSWSTGSALQDDVSILALEVD